MINPFIKINDSTSQHVDRGHAKRPFFWLSVPVDCPVCSVGIPQQMINKHLDSCLTRGEKKESLRR